MVFDNYAKYYNLLYRDKNYEAETDHVHHLIEQFSGQPAKKVLDIGCGTGIHANFMAKRGYTMYGIDMSAEMINQAIKKNIPGAHFSIGNATNFVLPEQFDAITSLFHVFSYQTTNEAAAAMINNACTHLKQGGLFVFDFWYGPSVLHEVPSVRIKRLENEEIRVTRIAEPVLKVNENIVDVNFELMIYDKERNQTEIIKEIHPMRYFFKPEIELLLDRANMDLLYFREWMTGNEASESTWGTCCVAVKNKTV